MSFRQLFKRGISHDATPVVQPFVDHVTNVAIQPRSLLPLHRWSH